MGRTKASTSVKGSYQAFQSQLRRNMRHLRVMSTYDDRHVRVCLANVKGLSPVVHALTWVAFREVLASARKKSDLTDGGSRRCTLQLTEAKCIWFQHQLGQRFGQNIHQGIMLAARQVVVIVLFATAASLVFLAILGPAPPTTLDVFYQPAPPKPRFILGDREYATFDDAANTRWDAVLPSTGGSVIATNMTSGFHFWAQLSMFHQLRCLRDIRAQLLRMSRSPAEAADFMAQHGLDSHYAQLGYCFDYILQVGSYLSTRKQCRKAANITSQGRSLPCRYYHEPRRQTERPGPNHRRECVVASVQRQLCSHAVG